MMKKVMVVFVLLMFAFSCFADPLIEDSTPETVDDCGFWCKVNEFLFGDSELRAATGTAWFDRSDNLVGFAGGTDFTEEKITPLTNGCNSGNIDNCDELVAHYEYKGGSDDVPKIYELNKKACEISSSYCDDAINNLKLMKVIDNCNNDPTYCAEVGRLYEENDDEFNVVNNPNEATKFYAKGCVGGDGNSCNILGDKYTVGTGVEKDLEKGTELYKKACDDGWKGGCGNLADRYEFGYGGVEINEEMAFKLYEKACDRGNGDAESCSSLGSYYQEGEVVEKDLTKAIAAYSVACEAGNSIDCEYIADIYNAGEGIDRNVEKAAQFYNRMCIFDGSETCSDLIALQEETGENLIPEQVNNVAALQDNDEPKTTLTEKEISELNSQAFYSNDEGEALELYTKTCAAGSAQGCSSAAIYASNDEVLDLNVKACNLGGSYDYGCSDAAKIYQEKGELNSAKEFYEKAISRSDGEKEGKNYEALAEINAKLNNPKIAGVYNIQALNVFEDKCLTNGNGCEDLIDFYDKKPLGVTIDLDKQKQAKENVEAYDFNSGSSSKIEGFTTFVDENKDVLENNNIDVNEVSSGNPIEIKKLQTLLGLTGDDVDGKFGAKSLNALKKKKSVLIAAAATESTAAETTPAPAPVAEETLAETGVYLTELTSDGTTFYIDDDGNLKVEAFGLDHDVIMNKDGNYEIDDWGGNTPLTKAQIAKIKESMPPGTIDDITSTTSALDFSEDETDTAEAEKASAEPSFDLDFGEVDPDSLVSQGKALYDNKDYEGAKEFYDKACAAGSANGCYRLGHLYDDYDEINDGFTSYNQAFKAYLKACNGGNAAGCNNLGAMYNNGEGVKLNKEKASEFYQKACDGGNEVGCNNLANKQKSGVGVTEDLFAAKNSYDKACALGEESACTEAKNIQSTIEKQKIQPPAYLTEQGTDALFEAVDGFGTDEDAIWAALEGKSDVEIAQIKLAYQKKHGVSLDQAMRDDLSDDEYATYKSYTAPGGQTTSYTMGDNEFFIDTDGKMKVKGTFVDHEVIQNSDGTYEIDDWGGNTELTKEQVDALKETFGKEELTQNDYVEAPVAIAEEKEPATGSGGFAEQTSGEEMLGQTGGEEIVEQTGQPQAAGQTPTTPADTTPATPTNQNKEGWDYVVNEDGGFTVTGPDSAGNELTYGYFKTSFNIGGKPVYEYGDLTDEYFVQKDGELLRVGFDPGNSDIPNAWFYLDENEKMITGGLTNENADKAKRSDLIAKNEEITLTTDEEGNVVAPGTQTKKSGATSPPAPAPTTPKAVETSKSTRQGIQQAVVCFQTGKNCVAGQKPLTHSEAAKEMDKLIKQNQKQLKQFRTEKPNSGLLESAPVKSTVSIDGKTYTKIQEGWADEDGKVIYNNGKLSAELKDKALANLETPGAKELAEEIKAEEEAKKTMEWQSSWMEGLGSDTYQVLLDVGDVVGGIATFSSKLGSYQALSNLLMPDETKEWMEITNNEFLNEWADLPAFASQAVCEEDDYKRVESPGKSSSFVRTQTGSYQFVGQIQAEKSVTETEILCDLDDVGESYCAPLQVCVDDFCYADTDDNDKPDDKLPLKGKYYKINWGVTAPQDEKHTPFVDENGKAVKFNLRLIGADNPWLYKTKGAIEESVMELDNGDSDSGLVIRYFEKDYSGVCIHFHPKYKITDYWFDSVDDICTTFVPVGKGKVEAGGSGSGSRTSSTPGVEYNI